MTKKEEILSILQDMNNELSAMLISNIYDDIFDEKDIETLYEILTTKDIKKLEQIMVENYLKMKKNAEEMNLLRTEFQKLKIKKMEQEDKE